VFRDDESEGASREGQVKEKEGGQEQSDQARPEIELMKRKKGTRTKKRKNARKREHKTNGKGEA